MHEGHEGIFGKKIATTRTLCFLNYKFLTKKKSSCITELSLTTEKKIEIFNK
jgi:hypothetical protein